MDSIFDIPITTLSFIVILSIVVFVHEFGHFFIARRNGVKCESFSIGFGPELFGFNDRHGTRWKFSLIPLGGYVKMFGEAETMQAVEGGKDEEPLAPRELTPEEKAVSFKYKTIGQRAAIVFAGPASNFIFAIVAFWFVFLVAGRPVTEAVVGQVVADSAAAQAGFKEGDRILSVDGEPVNRFEDVQRLVPMAHGEPMTFVVSRDGAELTLNPHPRVIEDKDVFGNVTKRALLGITASGERRVERPGVVQALGWSVGQTYTVIDSTLVAVGQMIAGKRGTEDLGGPIRIAKYSGQAARSGWINFVIFMAILSVNLGFINLLPVPLLDGGHLLFYAIEAVRGRPLPEQVQEWGLRVGLALVLLLMVFVTWNDIVQL